MRHLIQSIVLGCALWLPAVGAYSSPRTDALLDSLALQEVIEIMRLEGLEYSIDLAAEMLPAGNSVSWQSNVAQIYDASAMAALARGGFAEALEGVDLAPIEAFFGSENGQRLVQLEVTARRAMLDEDIEQSAKDMARAAQTTGDETYALISQLIASGDMLEANVVSALNSNILFYQGLVDGGAFALSEAEIIADVWSQENETRVETREWLYGFFLMAYDPLPPSEIAQFVAFSQTEPGKALNRAIFAAYDGMYEDISYALGRAVAGEMKAEDI